MVPGRQYNVRYVVRTLRRSWWIVFFPVMITGLLGAIVAKALPNVYYAQTTVVIVPQRIPDQYVRSTVTVGLSARLASTSQQVLSRGVLEPLITEFNLFPLVRNRVPTEVLVLWARSSIRVQVARGGEAFVVGFYGYNPERVKKVADRLAELFIREGVREREQLADGTSQFMETELQSVGQRLKEHEAKVNDYRAKNNGQLPSQLEANLRILQGSALQLQQVSDALVRAREERQALVNQIDTLSAQPDPSTEETAGTAAPPGGEATSLVELPPGPPPVQLRVLRAARDKALLRFTIDHPDVKALDRLIARVEAAVQAAAPGATIPASAVPTRLSQLRGQLRQLDDQIATRQAAENKLRSIVAMYQARVDSVPTREAEYVQLTRDYTTLQAVYSGLLAKREEARIAANLERQQVGEQFRIVERPLVPTTPVSPNRPSILLFALAIGGAFGFGVVVFRELRDVGLRAESEVVAALSLPVVGLVPTIVTRWDRRRTRRRRLLWSFAMLAFCVGVAALRWAR